MYREHCVANKLSLNSRVDLDDSFQQLHLRTTTFLLNHKISLHFKNRTLFIDLQDSSTQFEFYSSFCSHADFSNLSSVSEIMSVLLKSGQSTSQKEAVEKMKDCRSIRQHWCRSTVMPEYGLSVIYDRLKPRSHTKLPKYPWTTRNPIYVFLSHCWRLHAFYYHILLFSLRFGEKINSLSEIDWNSIGFIINLLSIILFKQWFVLLLAFLSNSSC